MGSNEFGAGRWTGRWVWAAPTSKGDLEDPRGPLDRRFAALRGALELDEVPSELWARAYADSRYVLWVNGDEAARGPSRGNPRFGRYDVIDLAPYLRVGRNVLAVLVCHYGRPTPWWMPGPTLVSPVARGGFVFEARPPEGVTGSSVEWRGIDLPGWTSGPPPDPVVGRGRERLDLRALPEGWRDRDFDDSLWPVAVELSGVGFATPGYPEPPTYPFGPLAVSALPQRTATTIDLERGDDAAFRADRVVVGTVEIDVEAPAGAAVELTVSEFGVDPRGDGQPPDGIHEAGLGATVLGDGTRRCVETFDTYGLRGLRVTVPGGGTVHGVRVHERLHPLVGNGAFACSDPLLDEIWQVGRRTVSICSLDAYVDCPTREQRAWTGDAVVHQMVDLTTNADWSLARWNPRLCASPRPDGMLPMAVAGDVEDVDMTVIPDWALHWIHSVWNLYRYLGDRDEVARLLPVAEGVLRWFDPYLDAEGCPTDVVGWVIIDWAANDVAGVSAPLCGLLGRALLEVEEISEWLDDTGRATRARSAHERLRAGFERLWDPERKIYVDCYVDGARRAPLSQHAQAAAIVGGLAPPERHADLVAAMTDEGRLVHASFARLDGPAGPGAELAPGGQLLSEPRPAPWWDVEREIVRAQPFFRYVVHDALAAAGRSDLIASQCRAWSVLLDRCPTSWSEIWFGGTVSHGWSSTPTRDLTTRVLGVMPAEPGFGVARIAPALGDLEWARGVVPTPAGELAVDIRDGQVSVDSPIPFDLVDSVHDRGGRHAPGRHELPLPAV